MAISWSFDKSFERDTDTPDGQPMTAATTQDVGPTTTAAEAPVEAASKPVERGAKRLAWLIGVTIALFVVFMTMILLSLTGKPAEEAFVEAADDLMTQSQRLAKATPDALRGDAGAMTQLRDSRDRLAAGVEALDKGGIIDNIGVRAAQGGERAALEPLMKDWAVVRTGVDAVLDNAKLVTTIGAAKRKLVDAVPAFVDGTDAFAAKVAASASPRDAVAAAQAQMLAQRIARRVSDLPAGADAAAALTHDASTYRETVDGLASGARDADVRDRAGALLKSAALFQGGLKDVADALPKVAALRQAVDASLQRDDAVLGDLKALRTTQVTGSSNYLWFTFAIALCSMMGFVLIARHFVDRAGLSADEARRGRTLAEEQEEGLKRANEANQVAILRLMNELQEVADGNLTVQATVSEDITGAIADSVNYTVEELRTLVGRINSTVEQVTGASTIARGDVAPAARGVRGAVARDPGDRRRGRRRWRARSARCPSRPPSRPRWRASRSRPRKTASTRWKTRSTA